VFDAAGKALGTSVSNVPNGDVTLMIDRQRFDLALRELGPGQWERFEQLASQFLVGDFDSLRTMEGESGDRGPTSDTNPRYRRTSGLRLRVLLED
jgi:hypothetical protein